MATGGDRDLANRLLDAVIPGEVDWETMVRAYPLAALGVAAAGGFYLGRAHGTRILEAVAAMASSRASEAADRLAQMVEGEL